MFRDKRRKIVPQIITENGYQILSVGDMNGIDISKYKLLVDSKGEVLPYQYFDANELKFVSGFPPSLGSGNGNYNDKFEWRYNQETDSLDLVILD